MVERKADGNHIVADQVECLQPDELKKRLHKAARAELGEQLIDDECAVVIIEGTSAQAMIVTNRHRVLVFKKGMMSGVTFGRKMHLWKFNQIHGVRVDVRLVNGFVALEMPGADVDNLSHWQSGDTSYWESGHAIVIGKSQETQAREGAAVLRAMLHRYHNSPDNLDTRIGLPPQSLGNVSVQSASIDPPDASREPPDSGSLHRFCFACGAELHTGAVFCSSCGQKVG